jgi:CDP-6-deoxy-D-xylo-4-hexulose-3-dehydrase
MIKLVSDTIDKGDILALTNWLNQENTPRLTKGDLTIELEKKWSKKIGTKYSVYVNSGSSAILLGLAAFLYSNKINNKKIVVPSLSWATDVSSPILLGMQPIMCDCNLEDLSCDLNHLEKIFKDESPSSFILVSALGFVPQMDKIINLCQKYNVTLFEDVCESMGSKYSNKYLGSFGFASFFSLYFGHHISTIEGGFICTDDEEFYYNLIMMRSHGWDRDLPIEKQKKLREKYNVDDFSSLYNFYLPGFNLRSTDLQAFIGLRSIDKLDEFSKIRNNNLKIYIENIKNNMLNLSLPKNTFNSNFSFPVVNKNKKNIIKKLTDNNIEVRPLIAGDMSKKPMWYNIYGDLNLKNCDLINEYGFYVPNHQDLNEEDIKNICNIINNG